jgi:hypothetical protein
MIEKKNRPEQARFTGAEAGTIVKKRTDRDWD